MTLSVLNDPGESNVISGSLNAEWAAEGESVSEAETYNMPGFENGGKPSAKECGKPLEAGKGKKMDYPSEPPEWNTVLLTSAVSPERPI